jgi:hypothetical protein
MNTEYEIERRPLGWLICAPPGQTGIPLTALNECLPMFKKNSVMNPGIAHHFNANRYNKQVVIVVATPKDSEAWEKEIAEELKDRDPQERWWLGTDTGKSSTALFAVLCREGLKWETNHEGQKATPQDAADFGRCKRLLDAIPEWKPRLGEVAEAYKDTAWPRIIAKWSELETAPADRANEILRECHNKS